MGYGTIPDLRELELWMRSGLTPQECSERYAERGEYVPAGTIAVARHRHGWPAVNMLHSDLIPWRIAAHHRNLFDHRMLRFESRRRQGVKLSQRDENLLDSWLSRLGAENAVIHYDADTAQGWWWLTRREGVDTDLIRVPNLDDEDEVARLRPQVVRQLTRR